MRTALAAVFGVATILGAFAFLLLSPGGASDSALLIALAVLVGIVGLAGALVKIASSESDDSVAPAPWDESGALVDRAPERSPADYDLSGEQLAAVVEEAGGTARDDGTVAAGVEVVRPHLREALLGVLVQGGTDRATAKQSLERGTWTDDATAAAVLDGGIDHPGWSFLERFEAWLFPEQVVRHEVQQAMQAIAEVADRQLPTVPGQRAPRTVPVVKPTLEDLRRGANGHLQRAVDPLGERAGSRADGATTVEETSLDDATADNATADDEGADESRQTASGAATDRREDESGDGQTRSAREPTDESLSDVLIGGRADERDDGEVTGR